MTACVSLCVCACVFEWRGWTHQLPRPQLLAISAEYRCHVEVDASYSVPAHQREEFPIGINAPRFAARTQQRLTYTHMYSTVTHNDNDVIDIMMHNPRCLQLVDALHTRHGYLQPLT